MFDVHIDFNEASREWRANKVSMKKGYFKYKCFVHGCEDILYAYTAQSPYFDTFATDVDHKYRHHPLRTVYCEEHLFLQHEDDQMLQHEKDRMPQQKEHAQKSMHVLDCTDCAQAEIPA